MNEFEWLRQMRDLRRPQPPARDLWSSIEASLDRSAAEACAPNATVHPRRHRLVAAAGLAAVLVLTAGIGWQSLRPHAQPKVAERSRVPASTPAWKPADPRFAGAAIELDAARMELRQALRQAPDSPVLQRLLIRTDQQQSQLRQLDRTSS